MLSGFLSRAFVRRSLLHSNLKRVASMGTRNGSFQVTNETEFNELVKNCGKPVLVSFYACWCKECDCMQVLVVGEIVKKRADEIRFVKVDVDKCTELALKYKVKGLPQLLMFGNGEETCQRLIGLQLRSKIEEMVDKAIEDHKKKCSEKK